MNRHLDITVTRNGQLLEPVLEHWFGERNGHPSTILRILSLDHLKGITVHDDSVHRQKSQHIKQNRMFYFSSINMKQPTWNLRSLEISLFDPIACSHGTVQRNINLKTQLG